MARLSEFTKLCDLPYKSWSTEAPSFVLYNNEIHMLGGDAYNSDPDIEKGYQHYKWDGTEWTSVSTLPIYFVHDVAFVYHDEFYIFGSEFSDDSVYGVGALYKWNNEEWIRIKPDCSLTLNRHSPALIYKDIVYFSEEAIVWDGKDKWNCNGDEIDNPYVQNIREGSVQNPEYPTVGIIYNDKIYSFDGRTCGIWDGTKWTEVTMEYGPENYGPSAQVIDNELYLFNAYGYSTETDEYIDNLICKFDGTEWSIVDSSESGGDFVGDTLVYDNKLYFFKYQTGECFTADILYDRESLKWLKKDDKIYGIQDSRITTNENSYGRFLRDDFTWCGMTNNWRRNRVTLLANSWSSSGESSQTIEVQEGIKSNSIILIKEPRDATSSQREIIREAQLVCTNINSNLITITADGEVPNEDIQVDVIII